MVSKRRAITTTAATFGAALTTIYAANELQADIVDLTFTPNSVIAGSFTVFLSVSPLGTSIAAINYYPGTLAGYNGLIGGVPAFNLGVASVSQTLTANTTQFSGLYTVGVNAGTGLQYVGFTFGGNVGWFSVDFSNPNVFFITGGQYGSMGESVHVGGTAIPEPSTTGLALLALGAIGVRRQRKAAAA